MVASDHFYNSAALFLWNCKHLPIEKGASRVPVIYITFDICGERERETERSKLRHSGMLCFYYVTLCILKYEILLSALLLIRSNLKTLHIATYKICKFVVGSM